MAPSPPRLRILSGWFPICPPSSNNWSPLLHFCQAKKKKSSITFTHHCHSSLRVIHASIVNFKMDDILMNVCVVGGNAVSAFLSWRLQATNACDVTLVWKSGFDAVYQYGISFKYVPKAQAYHIIKSRMLTGLVADQHLLVTSDSNLGMVHSPKLLQ